VGTELEDCQSSLDKSIIAEKKRLVKAGGIKMALIKKEWLIVVLFLLLMNF